MNSQTSMSKKLIKKKKLKKLRKLFLPKWVPWFIFLLSLLVIIFEYYELSIEKRDFTDFLFSILILTMITVAVFFVTYRHIPYLLLEVK